MVLPHPHWPARLLLQETLSATFQDLWYAFWATGEAERHGLLLRVAQALLVVLAGYSLQRPGGVNLLT